MREQLSVERVFRDAVVLRRGMPHPPAMKRSEW
jgi:hypothetical protein